MLVYWELSNLLQEEPKIPILILLNKISNSLANLMNYLAGIPPSLIYCLIFLIIKKLTIIKPMTKNLIQIWKQSKYRI